MAFGAAPGPKSKLWYTLVDGALSEVFFPSIDRVAFHELRFFASAGGALSEAPGETTGGTGSHCSVAFGSTFSALAVAGEF